MLYNPKQKENREEFAGGPKERNKNPPTTKSR
jgi:hypothetical protein